MSDLTTFNHEVFGNVRIVIIDDDPWFVASDLAKALGYERPNDAVRKYCEHIHKYKGPKQAAPYNIVPESDMYMLTMESKIHGAKLFRRWIVDEVLPSIRKHGAYLTSKKIEEILSDPDTIIRLATDLKNEREKRMSLAMKIEEDRPKVEFAEAVAVAKTVILVGELAKLIKQSTGYNTGQRRLFAWLRENGFVHKVGSQKNLPTQKAIDAGILAIKEGIRTNSRGYVYVTRTTVVTGLGQTFFVNKFKQLVQEQLPQCNLLQGRAA